MPRIRFSLHSDIPPERIVAAAKDFSTRRPELWPNISAEVYEVHEIADDHADVTEGGRAPIGLLWAREHYDWPAPNYVRGTVVDSNVFYPGGTWEMWVTPRNGGSHVEVLSDRRAKGWRSKVMSLFMVPFGRFALAAGFRKTLQAIEREWSAESTR